MINMFQKEKWEKLWSILGFCAVAAAGILYLILQDNIVVNYHDQMDGEVIGYILHAKYLFQGVSQYPEMMKGISPNGLFMPAPLMVFLYKLFTPDRKSVV